MAEETTTPAPAPAGNSSGGGLFARLKASFEAHKNLYALLIAAAGLLLTYLIYKQSKANSAASTGTTSTGTTSTGTATDTSATGATGTSSTDQSAFDLSQIGQMLQALQSQISNLGKPTPAPVSGGTPTGGGLAPGLIPPQPSGSSGAAPGSSAAPLAVSVGARRSIGPVTPHNINEGIATSLHLHPSRQERLPAVPRPVGV